MDSGSLAITAAFVSSAALSFLQPYLALPLLAAAFFVYASRRKRSERARMKAEREALEFLGRLSKGSAVPFARRAEEAAAGLSLEKQVMGIVGQMQLYHGGRAPSYECGTECLSGTMLIVNDAIVNGIEVGVQLDALLSHYQYINELRLKHVGAVSNALSLMEAGNSIFFPMFAGISGRIAAATAAASAAQQTLPFTFVIVSFIAIMGSVSGYFQKAERLAGAASAASAGIVVFNIVGALGSLIL